MGACITETDRQFYSPKAKYVLKLKDGNGKVLSEGSETFIKKANNRKFEGGFPKALDYGPHNVSFKQVAHVDKNKWYELCLKISDELPSICPLLVCKCVNRRTEYFGVDFEFETSYAFSKSRNNLESFDGQQDDKKDEVFFEDNPEDEQPQQQEQKELSEVLDLQDESEDKDGLIYGLISRLYFYY